MSEYDEWGDLDGAIARNFDFTGGESQDYDLTPQESESTWGTGSPSLNVDFAGGESQDHDLTSKEAEAIWGTSDPDALSKLLGVAKDLFMKKNADGTSSGSIDWTKLLTLGGGAIAMGRSNNQTQPSGYQGKIPKYTATRQAPGPDGKLSGNVTFTPKGIAAAETGATLPSGGIADSAQEANVVSPNLEGKRNNNLYANDPEYLRLSEAARKARGDSLTMDYKPEEQALSDYMWSKNPEYRANKEFAMGQAENQAGISAALPTTVQKVEAAPAMARGGALQSGGFVIPADVVSHLGNGSSEAGLRLLAKRYGAAPIKGKGDGMSDSIKTTIDGRQPARVANEEAQLTKAQVNAAGGAKKLYAMMDNIRQARTGSKKQGKQINPEKFMPGGAVGYAAGGTTTIPAGTVGTESNLSNWAGDYVTDMLGKGQVLSEMPYEQYGGKLSAGSSDLQNKVSTGLQAANFPGVLGQSFSSSGAPSIGADGQPVGGGGIASNYMNPYLSAVLTPQLAELRRQAEINNQSSLGGLTKSGAFGGGRQAIMESEAGRNLLNAQNTAIGQGYSNAFDKGMSQFNTEQNQGRDLVQLMGAQGAVDRGIESEEIAANKSQFEEARLNPYKMVQFQQSLLSGLPLAAQTYNQAPTDNFTQFSRGATTINELLKTLGQTG
jgi:hypothetical protein